MNYLKQNNEEKTGYFAFFIEKYVSLIFCREIRKFKRMGKMFNQYVRTQLEVKDGMTNIETASKKMLKRYFHLYKKIRIFYKEKKYLFC